MRDPREQIFLVAMLTGDLPAPAKVLGILGARQASSKGYGGAQK